MRRLVYVIGEPGVGKSTAVALALTETMTTCVRLETRPFAHSVYLDPTTEEWRAVYLGVASGIFPGTDRLSMNVQPKALAYISETRRAPLWIGEGDRLGTYSFLVGVANFGLDVLLVRCVCERAALDERRDARAREVGKAQNPTWLLSRRTKVERLWRQWPGERVEVSTDGPPGLAAASIAEYLR